MRTLPVVEDPPYVWVWPGEPAHADLRAPEHVAWLTDAAVVTCGGTLEVDANYLLLHENFADVTHVPFVHPEVSPPVLDTATPPLEVEVTEAAVKYARNFPAAVLPAWHSSVTGLPAAGEYQQRQSGTFLSPALWTESWAVFGPGSTPGDIRSYCIQLALAVTPLSPTTCRLIWRGGHDFSTDKVWVTASLRTMFTEHYARVARVVEKLQATATTTTTPQPAFNVTADAAALQVRRIVSNLLAEEAGGRRGRRPRPDARGTFILEHKR